MGTESRLKRLEATHQHSTVCSACGSPADGKPPDDLDIIVIGPAIRDFSKPPEPVDTSKDFCAKCGAQLMFRITAPPPAGTRGARPYAL